MIIKLVQSLLLLRIKYPISITSWGRTPVHNKAVGGVDDSDHLIWLGIDVVLDENKKNLQFEKDCDRLCLSPLWEGDHYHLRLK